MDEVFIESALLMQETQRQATQDKIAKVAIPTDDLTPEKYLTLTCVQCGEDLPEFRMKKGRIRCVVCEDKRERNQKLRG